MNSGTLQVQRHRTAILRRKLSKPVQLLIDDGILSKDSTFFDFGCGRGEDVRILGRGGYQASGWDPHYADSQPKRRASIVNLGYVINIIEDPEERFVVTREAFDLAEDLLCVSVMIRDPGPDPATGERAFGDGVLTSWNTFQRYFAQSEARQYIQEATGHEASPVGLGVFYLFKTDKYRETYLQSRLVQVPSASAEFREAEYRRIMESWVAAYHELGRPPSRAEFPEYSFVIRAFGGPEAAAEAVRAELDPETVADRSRIRKEQAEVAICRLLVRGQGRAKYSQLNESQQADVRIFYGNFELALQSAHAKLKSLADLSEVSNQIEKSPVGKILPDDIYIHADSLDHAPEMLQIMVELALMIVPEDLPYNIVKIARNSWHVTFLNYPEFHSDAHPALNGSMKVLLHKNDLKYRDYSKSENPPVLHRKETFLHPEHPRFEIYSQLTQAEEDAGLLGSNGIGHRKQWAQLLKDQGYTIQDHTLSRLSEA